jgi:hypothetical protein
VLQTVERNGVTNSEVEAYLRFCMGIFRGLNKSTKTLTLVGLGSNSNTVSLRSTSTRLQGAASQKTAILEQSISP